MHLFSVALRQEWYLRWQILMVGHGPRFNAFLHLKSMQMPVFIDRLKVILRPKNWLVRVSYYLKKSTLCLRKMLVVDMYPSPKLRVMFDFLIFLRIP